MNIIEDALSGFDTISCLTRGSKPVRGIKINETSEDCVTITEKDGSVFLTYGKDVIKVQNAPLDQTLNVILETSRTYELWERDLFHIIFNGCSLQDIVNKAFPLFKNPIFFIDETDRVLARTNHSSGTVNDAWDYLIETGYMPFDSSSVAHDSIERNIQASHRRGKNVPFLFSPPTRDIDNRGINYRIYSPESGEVVGTLIIIENETPVTLGMLNLSEILTGAVDEWMQMHRNNHPFKNDRDLVKKLIEEPEKAENKNVLKRYIRPCDEGYRLAVVIGCGGIRDRQIESMLETALDGSRAYKFGEEVILIIPLLYSNEEIRRKLDQVLYYDGIRVGMSYAFFDLTGLNSFYRQAKVALSYGTGKFSGISPDLAMRYYTEETSKGLFGTNIAHPALEKLKEYDEMHGGELFDTLYQFLRQERSLINSARALNIHRNSLIYRIEKIKTLTGVDLDDPDIREYILFSYRMYHR